MFKAPFLMMLLLFPLCSFSGELTPASPGSGGIPPHAITVKASHMTLDVHAYTEGDSVLADWKVLDQFRKSLINKAKGYRGMEVKRVASNYYHRTGSSPVFGSYNPSSGYRFRVSFPIDETAGVIASMEVLNKFYSRIEAPKNVKIKAGEYALALEDKDSYKAQLLSNIESQVSKLSTGLGGSYSAKLLEFSKTMRVQQNGEDTVALYYSYDLEFKERSE